jgi:hypothetical protein
MKIESLLGIRNWFSRFAVALGGFLIFVGIVVVAFAVVVCFCAVDFSLPETENFQSLVLLLLLVIGLFDLLAGVILWRR